MTLLPAYGRDYKSAKAVKLDWDAGKDFIVADLFSGGGRYINKTDAVQVKGSIFIRYDGQRKIVEVRS